MRFRIAMLTLGVLAVVAAPALKGATAVEMLKGVKFSVVAFENGKPAVVKPAGGEQDIENMRVQVEKALKELDLDFTMAEDCTSASADVVMVVGMEQGVVVKGGILVLRKSDKKELLRADWTGQMDGRLDITTPLPPAEMAKVRAVIEHRLMLADLYIKLKAGLAKGRWGKGDVSRRLPRCF